MKRITAIAFLAVFLFPTVAAAVSVNLLDSSYRYDIYQVVSYPESEAASGRISGTSDQPLYRELMFDPLGGWVSAEPFSLAAGSRSWDVKDFDEISGNGHAFISGTWTFKPIEAFNQININRGSSPWDAYYIILSDTTDNTELFNGSQSDADIFFLVQHQ